MLLTPRARKSCEIMGPAEAPVPRLKNEYRYQFLIKAASRKALNELLQRVAGFRAGAQVGRHGAGDRRGPAVADVTGPEPAADC